MLNSLYALTLLQNFGAGCAEKTFFGLRPWYAYLTTTAENGGCTVKFDLLPENGRSDLLLVLLVVIDDLLRVAGLVAIGFIIWGGVTYITSQGDPQQTQKAQQTINNALLGLAMCIMSIAVVTFIGSRVG